MIRSERGSTEGMERFMDEETAAMEDVLPSPGFTVGVMAEIQPEGSRKPPRIHLNADDLTVRSYRLFNKIVREAKQALGLSPYDEWSITDEELKRAEKEYGPPPPNKSIDRGTEPRSRRHP